MTETIDQSVLQIEQKNSFKLVKNTKGYNWEIKVIADNENDLIDKVKKLNDKAFQEWGVE